MGAHTKARLRALEGPRPGRAAMPCGPEGTADAAGRRRPGANAFFKAASVAAQRWGAPRLWAPSHLGRARVGQQGLPLCGVARAMPAAEELGARATPLAPMWEGRT